MNIGLDIGTSSIKMVELASAGANHRLKASGIAGYIGPAVDDLKSEKEFGAIAEVIKKLHKEAKIKTKDTAISLPETQVFTRTVKFPLLNDTEIASAVKWEADQYIPIPEADAIIQHQILEKNEDSTPPQATVLLVAAPKELVEKYTKVVEMAGLKLVAVETELMALIRSLAPHDQIALIVDFGAKSADIAIAKNGSLTFSRSTPTAGEAFTRAVEQGLGIDKTQAEQYKRTYGLATDQLEGKIKTSLDPVMKLIASEMKKAIQFYQSEEQGDSPKLAILSGGTAALPGITSAFTKMLGIEVIIGNPFKNVVVDKEALGTISSYAPFYSVAVGLALRK